MSGDIMFYSQEAKEQWDKAVKDWMDKDRGVWYQKEDKIVFTNDNGTVWTGEEAPNGMASLEIESKIYWSKVEEVQALQDYLSLKVQQAKRRDAKLALNNKGIKKVRNKMTHLKPAKNKRR